MAIQVATRLKQVYYFKLIDTDERLWVSLLVEKNMSSILASTFEEKTLRVFKEGIMKECRGAGYVRRSGLSEG